MVNLKIDATFIVPCYNPPEKLFRDHVESLLQHDMKIVICDDGSDKETKNLIKELYGNNQLVTIKTHKNNKGHQEAIRTCVGVVKTPFLIRVDADDEYLKIPEFDNDDWDVLLLQKTQDNLSEYLEIGGSPVGGVFKTEVYKEVFEKDFKFKDDNEEWIHEDIWTHINLLTSGYKLSYATNSTIYHRHIHPLGMTIRKNNYPDRKRWETFMFWCHERNDFGLYLKMQNMVLELHLYKRNLC